MNCYATPSALIEPGRVYVHFGSFGTACLDTSTGKAVWKREDLHCRHYRGPSSSVVLFENLVILTFDGADVQYHVALDKQSGKTVWKTDRSVAWNDEDVPGPMAKDGDLRKAHSTPLIVTAAGKPQKPNRVPPRRFRREFRHPAPRPNITLQTLVFCFWHRAGECFSRDPRDSEPRHRHAVGMQCDLPLRGGFICPRQKKLAKPVPMQSHF